MNRQIQIVVHQTYLHIAKQNGLLMILLVLAESVVKDWETQILLVQSFFRYFFNESTQFA